MDALSEHPDDVLCCAPTGKAAQRLKESTGYDAQTIHRGFGYHPVYGWPDIPVPYNKVMIDEGSMIDAELASTIFRLIPDDAQVVWLGDPNQLPAVGPGDVLRDMTRIEDIPTAEITQIVRQAEDSVIVKNAHNILNQRELEFSMGPGVEGGVYGKWFNDNADSSKIAEEIPKWLDVAAKSYQLDPKDVQVLIPGKKGACGVKEVNEILSNHLNPRVDGMTVRKLPNGHTIAPGDKVINTKNNYDEWVFNGDWGFVREISTGKKTSVTIEWDAGKEGTVTKTISGSKKLSAIIPAWAITVHRSQGSEYPVVFIIAVREHTFMWSSQLLYTAMTRAKRGVYIAGQRRTIKNALSKRGRQQRNTNLVQIWEGSKNA
jgi:exodeoxyribonuclease V alpha subunit